MRRPRLSRDGLEARWRTYQEQQALSTSAMRLVARLTPGPPTEVGRAGVPTLPQRAASVSVVVPCYNYGRYLTQAVESALDQPGVDVEVIVVDDCSTDDSREVAAALADRHPGVSLVVNDQNSGHVRSFNAGWERSTGDLVVKLDADDLLTPGSLSRAAALFEAFPDVALVYGHPRHFSTPEPPPARVGDVRWTVWSGRSWLAERCRLGVSAITNPEMVLRSSVLRELGPMNPAVPYAPDLEISLRVATVAHVGYVGGADQALHREHASSMSETDGSGALVDLRARAAAFCYALRDGRADDTNRLGRSARRALAQDAVRYAGARVDGARGGAEVEGLLGFAAEVWPESSAWAQVRRLQSGDHDVRLVRSGRRLLRKVRHEAYFARWMVTGV